MAVTEPLLRVDEIQGNVLRGFGTDRLLLLGYKVSNASVAKRWLAGLSPEVSSVRRVHETRLAQSAEVAVETSVFLNCAFSFFGLQQLGFRTDGIFEGLFRFPMATHVPSLVDLQND